MSWLGFFIGGWGTTFSLYVLVQTLVALKLKGTLRMVSLIPALPMALVAAWTIFAYVRESNLWPILMIFASPVALAFVILVWLVSLMRKHAPAA